MKLQELPEISVYSPEFLAEPHGVLRQLREKHKMVRSERGIELLAYAPCEAILRDPSYAVGFDEMMAATGINDGPDHETIVSSINNTEGGEHARLRKAIMPYLVPAKVEKLRGSLRAAVEERLFEIDPDGGCDLVETLARWLPATAFCFLTGAPLEDRELIWRLSDHAQRFFEMKPLNRETVEHGLEEVEVYMDGLLSARRSEPGGDILTFLLAAEGDGRLTPAEVRNLSMILLAASTDTTAGQLTNTIVALAEHPEIYARLREDESLIGNAVLESARFQPALWTTPRFAREGGVVDELQVEPETVLNALFISANRDPAVFDDPDRFDIGRELPRPPLNWSTGRHFCPGRSLAILEIEEAVRAVVRRWGKLRMAGPVESRGAPYIVAPTRAPVQFQTANGLAS